MKKLFLLAIASAFVFISCNKKLDNITPVTTVDVTSSVNDMKVPAGFDWKTTKTLDVNLVLPSDKGWARTRITSVDGKTTYFKGYPNDTTQRVLQTKITVPAYMEVLKVSFGVTDTYVDINGTNLSADLSSSTKSTMNSDAICGECEGQITQLTLRYLGSESNPLIDVYEHNGNRIFHGHVNGDFSFQGDYNHHKMGPKINMYVNGSFRNEIHTSCSQTILAGMTFGDFLIVSGYSDEGGPLCQVEDDEPETYEGTVIYEDLYPAKGDYDFNDLVISYHYSINKCDNNNVNSVDAEFTVKAFGASYHNAFGFQFPGVLPADVASVTGGQFKPSTIFNMTSNGVEANQSKATFIVYDDAYDILQHPGSGIGVNTTPTAPYVSPVTISMHIEFVPDHVSLSDLNIGEFNPFIVMKQDRAYEVHLANYPPTDLFNTGLFGVYDDASQPGSGVYFVTENNLPWAINIPADFDYMIEKSEISNGYLHFVEWAESGGTQYTDWYLNQSGYTNNLFLYPIP